MNTLNDSLTLDPSPGEIYMEKIKKQEWQGCLKDGANGYAAIERLEETRERVVRHKGKNWRQDDDNVRQDVDATMNSCQAVQRLRVQPDLGRNLDRLPCQKLRKRIMVDDLEGYWYKP